MKSVHFQIVPCSSLYFFSRSTGPFQCSPSYRVLICSSLYFFSRSTGPFQCSPSYRVLICSSLYFFSRSTGPFQCSPSYRVLICHFQSSSLFFILASSVCKSLQYLTSALTQGGEGGHLSRLTCSVVLWGGRNTANKYHRHVWAELAVFGPQWVCPRSRRVCAPGLYCSGSRLLCRGTV